MSGAKRAQTSHQLVSLDGPRLACSGEQRFVCLQGLRNSWRELCHSVWTWRPAAVGQQAPRNTATSKRRRFEAVSKIVQQLPVELYASEEDLRQLPLPDLKVSCVMHACGFVPYPGAQWLKHRIHAPCCAAETVVVMWVKQQGDLGQKRGH